MAGTEGNGYLAECFWPGVQQDDLRQLVRRIGASVAELAGQGGFVRYLGSMLIVDDEVVLCLFEGQAGAVRQVMEHAGIPFERILHCINEPRSR